MNKPLKRFLLGDLGGMIAVLVINLYFKAPFDWLFWLFVVIVGLIIGAIVWYSFSEDKDPIKKEDIIGDKNE